MVSYNATLEIVGILLVITGVVAGVMLATFLGVHAVEALLSIYGPVIAMIIGIGISALLVQIGVIMMGVE